MPNNCVYSLIEGKYLISILSCCTLSTFATSHHSKAFLRFVSTLTPRLSICLGISVVGPQTFTSAPCSFSAKILDNATRECKMSPTITIFLPATSPSFSLIE
jgi:hypothetical protein